LKYLNKGSKVIVAGRLQIDEYSKDDKHYKTPEIMALQVEFLTPKAKDDKSDLPFPDAKERPAEKPAYPSFKAEKPVEKPAEKPPVEDDLPF